MKWCDLSCEHASFPKAEAVDGAGSCRTFAALYCGRLARLVHKHGPCACPESAVDQTKASEPPRAYPHPKITG